jgi:predicted alpha-1,2-mannosidase
MKIIKFLSTLSLTLFLFLSCNNSTNDSGKDYTKYVDPFIGTGGHGHTFPGAMVPFGMVQLSPDTRMENWDGSSGYHYSDKTIMGFSHTHLSGTGAPEFCDILLMPTTGKATVLVGDENDSKTGYRSAFSHKNEFAEPGYYKVLLDDYNITAELTATTRTGFHRYTFPKSAEAHIVIDLKNRDRVINSAVNIISDTEISGFRRSIRWAKDQHVYFYAKFSKPFKSFGVSVEDKIVENIRNAEGTNIKAVVDYETAEGEKILVRVGISSVNIEGAKKNLEAENEERDFDDVRSAAKEEWRKHLAKIDVEGGTEREKRIFYTGLYHTAMAPVILNDADGLYRGVDRKIHKAEGFTRYTVWSLWDIFRAQMPLYTIIEPSRMNDYMKTFLEIYKNGGRLPHWEIWGEYSGSMIGHHALPIILDAYQKGIRGFDVNLAFKAMKNQVDHSGYYARMGFIPANKDGGSVSVVMEYAYNDWCIAEMAKLLGRENDYLIYQQRAQFYRNMYDPQTGFMRPKNSDRKWVTPFDPAEATEHFVEGNSFQYSLFAPQDINGLIDLIGGDKKFEAWLDNLFTYKSKYDKDVKDASGLIGQYAHGNEPSHHLAYLYDYVGAAPKTQAMIRQILETMYDDKPDGLKGNEDCGQMSAWYILSAMGFYPVTPGIPDYEIGSPIFDKVTVNLENGKKFVVEARNVSLENKYIQSAALNGKPYSKCWFRHQDIVDGSNLVFEMGSQPNYKWGTAKEDRPSTEPFKPTVAMPYIITDDEYFLHKAVVRLACDTKDAKIYYTTDGSEPTPKSNLYKKPIFLTKTADIKFAAYKEGLLNSLTVTEKVKRLDFENWTNYEKRSSFAPGLKYKYYEAKVMFVRELDNFEPLKSGIIKNFNIKNRTRNEYFAYIYEGYLKIPKDGIYTIYNKTNDGSILYLNGKEFLNSDGGHPASENFKTVALRKGMYKISQKYFQMAGGYMNQVSWKGPGITKEQIPPKALFHQR